MIDKHLHDHAERAARRLVNMQAHPDPCLRFNAVLAVLLKAVTRAAAEHRERLLAPSRN